MATHNQIPGDLSIPAGKAERRNAGDSAFETYTPLESGAAASVPSITLTSNPSADNHGVTRGWIISREHNLVTNGNGMLGNDHNFTDFDFVTDDAPGGGGSFYSDDVNSYVQQIDELLPANPESYYEMQFKLKTDSILYFQFLLYCFDIDKLGIGWEAAHHYSGSETTLANDLAVGDTSIVLTSSANWYNGSNSYSRGIRVDRWKNAGGYMYPPYTYTRYLSGTNAWAQSGISGNNITLNAAWPNSLRNPDRVDGKWLAGTEVSCYYDSNEAVAFYLGVSGTWTKHRNLITPCPANSIPSGSQLFPGTAFVRAKFYGYGNPTGWYKLNDVQFYRLRVNPSAAISAPSGGSVIDVEARAAINSMRTALQDKNIIL